MPRAAATPTLPQPGLPRARLLSALDRLSQTHSVLDIGINALLAEAGVAKASLYAHFGSKDDLIVAWLDERQQRWFGWFHAHLAAEAADGEPGREIDAAFGFLEAWLERADFSGCPFVSVQLQVKDPAHPAVRKARAYAERLHEFFRSRLLRLGAPGSLATTLLELYLGTIVVRQLEVGKHPALSARRSAAKLLRRATRRAIRPPA